MWQHFVVADQVIPTSVVQPTKTMGCNIGVLREQAKNVGPNRRLDLESLMPILEVGRWKLASYGGPKEIGVAVLAKLFIP
jgi:hypothetical protein